MSGRGRRAAGGGPRQTPACSPALATPRIARQIREAQELEQRQAEKAARRAREAQAWAQLKEREVLQLQVGSGRPPGMGDEQGRVCESWRRWPER